MRPFRFLSDRLKDLLYDPSNTRLDIGRTLGVTAFVLLTLAAKHNAIDLKQPLDLGPTGFPGGLATVLAAASVYIFKDRQQAGETPSA
jgi:hypothetical protein